MMPFSHFTTLPQAPAPSGESLCARCAARGTSCCATDPALGHLSFPLSLPEWRRLRRQLHLASEAADADDQASAGAEARNEGCGPLRTAGKDIQAPSNAEGRKRISGIACADEEERPYAPTGKNPEPGDGAATGEKGPPGEQTPPKDGDACCQPWDNTPGFLASMHALFPNERERIERLFPEGGKHFSLRLRKDGSCVFLGEGGCRLPRRTRPWYCLLFPIWFTVGGPGLFAAEGCLIAESAKNRAHAVRLMGVSLDSLRESFAQLREDWGLEQEWHDFHKKI